jgi:hypothetical protein
MIEVIKWKDKLAVFRGNGVCFVMVHNPQLGIGFLIMVDLRSLSDTPHSVGFLWTSDQPDAETST